AARDAARGAAYARFERAEERRRELAALLALRRTEARAGGAMADRRGTHALMTKVRQAERALERADQPGKPFEPWALRLRLEARTLLAKFGLGAEHIGRSGASLSPGERTRALLAELQARRVNLLVLDEPTNHLDLEAVEQLEAALETYTGTVVLVTHDRRFLERFGATRTIAL